MKIKKKQNIVGGYKKHINGYMAFIPADFPFEFQNIINDILNEKLFRAQHLVSRLSGITELLPDVNYFIKSFILKDAESSSQIEGTQATMIDVIETKISKIEIKDSFDIDFYIKAVQYGIKILNNPLPLSLRFIRTLHKKLMLGARSTHFSDPGEFRKSQNWIGGTTLQNASFIPPAPEHLVKALNDFEKFLHLKNINPIIQIALAHAQFETIHPFLDGNGRTGRLLITFLLIERELLDKPTLFLSTYFKKYQQVYYRKIADYNNGNVYAWLDFFIDGVIETAEQAIQITKQITDLREQDMRKLQGFGKANASKAIKILQYLYSQPIITSTQVMNLCKYKRQGAINLLEKLQHVDILKLYKKGVGSAPTMYIYTKYVDIFIK